MNRLAEHVGRLVRGNTGRSACAAVFCTLFATALFSQPCDNLILTSSSPAPYNAVNCIAADSGFSASGSITFSAGEYIHLGAGFHALPSFHASVLAPAPPSVVSVTPSNATGSQQTFTFQASDPNGGADVKGLQLLFVNMSGADSGYGNACDFWIDRWSRGVWLRQDTGSTWNWGSPATLGVAGQPLTNPQCSLNPGASSITWLGVNLTVNLAMTFTSAFAGTHNITMEVVDSTNLYAGALPTTMTAYTVSFTQPGLSLAITPGSQTITAGGSTSYTVTVTGSNGCSGTVSLSAQTPAGASASFSPASVACPANGSVSSTMTINTTGGVQSGSITVTGTDGGLSSSAGATLVVSGAQPDFSLSVSPGSATIAPGTNTNYTVTATGVSGFSGTVIFSASGLPAGASASFFVTGPMSATMTVNTSAGTPTGNYTLTVTGQSGGLSHIATASLSVAIQADFSLSTPPTRTVPRGLRAGTPVIITQLNGFNSPVSLSWTNQPSWPAGVAASFSQNPAMTSTTVTIYTSPTTPAGTYTLAFSGSGGGCTHSSTLIVAVRTDVMYVWDDRLVALDSGDTYAHFAVWTTGTSSPSFTNQMQGATVSGPHSWGPTDGPQTTGSTPSTVDFPDFRLADGGFGNYQFTYSIYEYDNANGIAYGGSFQDAFQYPTPSLTSAVPAYGSQGATVNVSLNGTALGIADLGLNAYRGITSVNVSGAGFNTTFSPQPFVPGQFAGDHVQATIHIPSNAAPGAYNLSLTAFGYTTNSLQFTVADSTPQITGIALSQPLTPNGSADASIYGYNFGSSGQLNVCRAGADPCTGPTDVSATVTSWGCYPALGYCQVNASLSATAQASGAYDLQITSNGSSGQGFFPAPDSSSQRNSNRGQVVVNCATVPSVIITTRPMALTGAFPDTGFPYSATLTASGAPAGGTYHWSSDNPGMIQISPDQSLSATVNLTVTSPGRAKITVTYTNSCGAVAQDSLTFVLSDDITVVGWIDGSAITLPSGASPLLVGELNGSATFCFLYLVNWANAGMGSGITFPYALTSDIDRQYATAWLNKNSANSAPPSPMSSPSTFEANVSAYRAFNRFKAYYEVTSSGTINTKSFQYLQSKSDIGVTPEPCSPFKIGFGAQAHLQNGISGFGPTAGTAAYAFQLNEGRVGPVGQEVNAYLNHPNDDGSNYFMATPFIWSVIQLDQNGHVIPLTPLAPTSTTQVFPTYYVYQNGNLVQMIPQGQILTFTSLDWTSTYLIP